MDFPMTISIERPVDLPATAPVRPRSPWKSRLVGIGTAVSDTSFSQQDLLDTFEIADPKVRSVFLNSAIQRRHLTLPPLDGDGNRVPERQGELLDKHKALAVEMGAKALHACLDRAGAGLADIGHLCCVTST